MSLRILVSAEGDWILGTLYASMGQFTDESIPECAVRKQSLVGKVQSLVRGLEGCMYLVDSSLCSLLPSCHYVSSFSSAIPPALHFLR